jgi:tellurite methyltransferase
MTMQDAVKWNQRYQAPDRAARCTARSFLLEQAQALPCHGLALDIAMGLGTNAAFLSAHGLRVIGLDISEVAARTAKTRCPSLQAAVVDLSYCTLPPAAFDVIVNFYFLDRRLWPWYRRALKPGGVLIVETLTRAMLAVRPDINPVYLLEPGELQTAFADWRVIAQRETWLADGGWQRAVASLAVQRP